MNTYADQISERLTRLLPDIPLPVLDGVHPKIYQRVSEARTAFLKGFQEALCASPEALPQLLENEPSQRRGFALEGAAMALTLMDEFSPASQGLLRILLDGRSAEERILGAIGVGWASARLGKSFDWLPTALHSCHKYAVADGYGFHQGFFHPHRFTSKRFPKRKSELSTFYDIGLGRALWFIHIGSVALIVHTIDKFLPDRREPLWCGVGTACAFTGNTALAATQMSEAAGKFESHFWAGLETGTQLLCALAQRKEAIL
jgi:hypothetical protein